MNQESPAPKDPIRPTDDEARAMARGLMAAARHAALGVTDPEHGGPLVTRIALVAGSDGAPLSLVSDLSLHTRALRADPRASLLIGEPGSKGDPLTHPRLTVQAEARFVAREDPDRSRLRALILEKQPKAKLYVDFADFHILRFLPRAAHLNGGFGRAYRLTAEDLGWSGE